MNALGRIEEKLMQSKKNANFYEAHQLYTTLYYRYNLKQKHESARNLMIDGAKYLFENNQTGSAADLCMLYLESLEKNVDEISDDVISTVALLHSLMPCNMPEVEIFDKRALLWSSKCKNAPKTGDKELRKQFALTYWQQKMYCEARRNFLYATDGNLFGKMLQEFAIEHGYTGETDLFLAQAVLQLLCLQSYEQAVDVFASYTQNHPKIGKGPPFRYPLINFLCFLLTAIKKKQQAVFSILCEQYQISLKRDALYIDYLEKIAENYFGIKAQKKQSGGLLENIMQSLFDEDDLSTEGAITNKKTKVTRTMTEEDLD